MLTLGSTFGSLLFGTSTAKWAVRKVLIAFTVLSSVQGGSHLGRRHPRPGLRARYADQRLRGRPVHSGSGRLCTAVVRHGRRVGQSASDGRSRSPGGRLASSWPSMHSRISQRSPGRAMNAAVICRGPESNGALVRCILPYSL